MRVSDAEEGAQDFSPLVSLVAVRVSDAGEGAQEFSTGYLSVSERRRGRCARVLH